MFVKMIFQKPEFVWGTASLWWTALWKIGRNSSRDIPLFTAVTASTSFKQ